MLGLRFCARAFCSCGKRGPLFITVRGPLTLVASLVEEHRLQTRRLSNCGSRAQLLRGMWDLPRPGRKPVSPALAGRFSTTAPPGKPPVCFFNILSIYLFIFGWVGAARRLSLVGGGATLRCGARASHCSGFSCRGARALGLRASVVVAHGLSSCGLWALERRLSSCGAQA